MKCPECYLHIEDCRSGQMWIEPIKGNQTLNLETRIKSWIKKQFGGELVLDSKIMPRLQGDYYAKIMTDGRPPESVFYWTGGGFYLKSSY